MVKRKFTIVREGPPGEEEDTREPSDSLREEINRLRALLGTDWYDKLAAKIITALAPAKLDRAVGEESKPNMAAQIIALLCEYQDWASFSKQPFFQFIPKELHDTLKDNILPEIRKRLLEKDSSL